MTTSKTNPQVADGTLPPVVGQFISSECLGNFYVNSPSGDIIAMTPRRKLAQAIADAMNRSKGRTAKLMRQGWTVGRDDMLYPPDYGREWALPHNAQESLGPPRRRRAGGREVKKEIKINFRVEVYPRTTLAEEEDVCISIVADINRHVNDVRFTEIVSDFAEQEDGA